MANLAYELSRRGHKVYVFTAASSWKEKIEYNQNLYIFRHSSIMRAWQTFISLSLLIKPLMYEIDVVHIEGGIIASLSGFLYSVIKRKPLVITVHHMGDVWKDPIKQLIVRVFEKCILQTMLRKARKIIVPSKFLLLQSTNLSKFGDKIVPIPNGIDISSIVLSISKEEARQRLKLPSNSKLVLFIGSLCRRKGIHLLLESVDGVIGRCPECLFLLVGTETREVKQFRELVKNKKLDRYVVFTGFVPESAKAMYYRVADLFVLPSLSEGFGLVVLEAAANELPAVVSDLPVFRTMVRDSFNGLIAKRNDPTDLTNKILYLLKNNQVRTAMGRNAKIMASHFSWSKTAKETERLYKRIAKN